MSIDPSIKQKADDIRNKIYGKEVRESLASGLEEMSSDVVELESQWQSVIDETTNLDVVSAPEIIAARNGEANLKARLDKENQEVKSQLAKKANREEVRQDTNTQPINVREMDTETKQLFTGGAVAVVGANAVGNENVKSKAISPINTTFFKLSSNLIDENNVTPSTTLDDVTGEPVPSSSGNTLTDYIRITPSTAYTSIDVYRKAFYDKDKTFISSDTLDGTWVSPSNAIYVRLVLNTVRVGNRAALNIGTELLPFEKYYEYIPEKHLDKVPINTDGLVDGSVEPMKTNFFETKSNLFNRDLVTRSRSIPEGSGEPVYNKGFHVSNYIRVLPSTLYTTYRVFRVTYYDASKNYISEDTLSSVEIRNFTTPDNAMYVRLTISGSSTDLYVQTAQLNEGSELLPYEKGGEFINNAFIKLPETSFTDKNSGETTTYDYENNTSFKTSGDVPIIDVDINKTFNSNVVLPENAAVITSSLSADIYDLYDELMAQYPTYITKTLLGNEPSPSALPIYRYDFKPKRPDTEIETKQAKLLITTGTHPELGSVWTLYNTMDNICNNWQDDELLEALRFNVHFIIVPVMSPWAYDNRSRVNYNGVDLARNFPAKWTQGNFGDITYGGPEPLSEIEAQVINQIMIDNPDLLGVIDYHNFDTPSDGYYFIWGAVANKFTRNVTMSHIQRMDRKWKKEHTFVNQDPDVFMGNVNYVAPNGSLGVQADFYNIKLALTYETCIRMPANPNTTSYDSDTMTMGYEAFINFLLVSISETLKRL